MKRIIIIILCWRRHGGVTFLDLAPTGVFDRYANDYTTTQCCRNGCGGGGMPRYESVGGGGRG